MPFCFFFFLFSFSGLRAKVKINFRLDNNLVMILLPNWSQNIISLSHFFFLLLFFWKLSHFNIQFNSNKLCSGESIKNISPIYKDAIIFPRPSFISYMKLIMLFPLGFVPLPDAIEPAVWRAYWQEVFWGSRSWAWARYVLKPYYLPTSS